MFTHKQKLRKMNVENTTKMPVLFIGHGNPMNAIENNEFTNSWEQLSVALPRPAAVLCISAHWETRGTFITLNDYPKTIHDFGGFPKELFNVEYPAPGKPELVEDIKSLNKSAEIKPSYDWGLDHGCWSVLKRFYPMADIPIVQMSIDYTKPLSFHLELAKELIGLREKGILIIGSGNLVHNLGMINWQMPENGYDWAQESNEGFKRMILDRNISELTKGKFLVKAYQLSVPTPEHYIPLLYALGLSNNDEEISFFNDKVIMGSLAMTSVLIKSVRL
jgi:4,5-DOPA dioxygenase extradiol